jgi:uncharacterized protein (DUF111 family)
VLAELMKAGASDAWLVPIVMKKGRPAHTLCVLGHPSAAGLLRETILLQTSTIGVREHALRKHALPRAWTKVTTAGGEVAIKIAHTDGVIRQATPEFDDIAAVAEKTGTPVRVVLAQAIAAAEAAGLTVGGVVPENAHSNRAHSNRAHSNRRGIT